MRGWPVNLIVEDQPILVVGAGQIATRKITPLIDAGAQVTVVSPEACDQVKTWANKGRLTLHERAFEPSDCDNHRLAIAATDKPEINRAVFEAAEQRNIWANSADDPENCSFTLMSTVKRSDITIAFSTAGRSPALSAHLRRKFDQEIGPEYVTLLEILEEKRNELKGAGVSTEDADWQSAFDAGIVEMVREGQIAQAKELLQKCL